MNKESKNKASFPACKEMRYFRDLLDRKGIPWEDASYEDMCVTFIRKKRKICSVINGIGSDGGAHSESDMNHGKLEFWDHVATHDMKGWLTAADAVKLVEARISFK